MIASQAQESLVAVLSIEPGATVTGVILYGSDPSVTWELHEVSIQTGAPNILGSSTLNTLLVQPGYESKFTKYLLISIDMQVAPGAKVYGGKVIGTGGASILRITPDMFLPGP